MKKQSKKVSALVKADRARTERNKKAGLVKISPSHWVQAEKRDEALAAIRKVVQQYK